MTLHQCSHCELSSFSNQERLDHEKVCPKNRTITSKQRFKNRMRLNQKRKNEEAK